MARKAFVSLDGSPPCLMRIEIAGHGYIRSGTTTRGRRLFPTGRGRMIDPREWIDFEVVGIDPKSIGNAACYRARRIVEAVAKEPARQGSLF